jgi:type II pantothenate kinase
MKTVIGIDVGGSTTKIVGFRRDERGERVLVEPQFVRATDPVTSIYGAFGKFTMQNGLELGDISRIMMTGAGSSVVTKPIYNLNCVPVPEFTSVGLGGLYLSGLNEAIVVSMGTGTAIIHAKHSNGKYKINYLGGTGVGGGTMVGLAKKMLGVDQVDHIEQLCEGGDLGKVDLRIRDISNAQLYSGVDVDLTASNFGKLSDLANKHDIALGIVNMVAETIAMMAIFSARAHGLKDIVLTGNLTSLAPIREVFMGLEKNFGVRFIIPELSQFGTVIGAALCEEETMM